MTIEEIFEVVEDAAWRSDSFGGVRYGEKVWGVPSVEWVHATALRRYTLRVTSCLFAPGKAAPGAEKWRWDIEPEGFAFLDAGYFASREELDAVLETMQSWITKLPTLEPEWEARRAQDALIDHLL